MNEAKRGSRPIRNITISREYGSGGGLVAEILARRLGWRVIDDSLIARISEALHASPEDVQCHDETVDPWFQRIMKVFWRGGFEGAMSRPEAEPVDADSIKALWNRAIVEAAEAGGSISVGRGGQCLLRNRPDAFHVCVYAPMSEKVARLREHLPEVADLRAAATDRDRRRKEYMRHYFNVDWRDPHLYDLMICSSIGLERVADVILMTAGLSAEKAC
jgi:cytidylate kinase